MPKIVYTKAMPLTARDGILYRSYDLNSASFQRSRCSLRKYTCKHYQPELRSQLAYTPKWSDEIDMTDEEVAIARLQGSMCMGRNQNGS